MSLTGAARAADETHIPLSKARIKKLLAMAVLLVAGSAAILGIDTLPIGLRVAISGAGIAFFGASSVIFARRLFRAHAGLSLTPEGMVDRSSALALGLVRWPDVTAIDLMTMNGVEMIIVRVTNPELYVRRGNFVQRMLNRGNMRMVGSPVFVAPIALATDSQTLRALLERYVATYGGSQRLAADAPERAGDGAELPSVKLVRRGPG